MQLFPFYIQNIFYYNFQKVISHVCIILNIQEDDQIYQLQYGFEIFPHQFIKSYSELDEKLKW